MCPTTENRLKAWGRCRTYYQLRLLLSPLLLRFVWAQVIQFWWTNFVDWMNGTGKPARGLTWFHSSAGSKSWFIFTLDSGARDFIFFSSPFLPPTPFPCLPGAGFPIFFFPRSIFLTLLLAAVPVSSPRHTAIAVMDVAVYGDLFTGRPPPGQMGAFMSLLNSLRYDLIRSQRLSSSFVDLSRFHCFSQHLLRIC